MKSQEIRQKFFDFFMTRNHMLVPSSSLIPAHDPTLLFVNAGMNQFKDIFLGKEKRSYQRAVSIQKCIRAGGKHNDLDNVGFTKRHLTFFEMMGNFSFGDYFKKDAIEWAWEFITKKMNIPQALLSVSVYETDNDAYDIWHNIIGISKKNIFRLGKEDNFWQMGDLGPCGPCTEIFIDRGAQHGCAEPCGPACSCDRFLELWNLVFMEFDLQADGSLKPLQNKGVDTGMGLERLCTIMQGKDSVYETDLFTPIIQKTEILTSLQYDKQSTAIRAAFRVVADHIRSTTMIISDGGAPSNEGRGYVLRKIIRRGALFAQKLTPEPIFPQLATAVIEAYSAIYPELKENKNLIISTLTNEIEKFSTNLIRGQQILNQFFDENKESKQISGKQAFKLYDTFGFPLELVLASAREKGYSVNTQSFEKEMEKQQAQSGKKTSDPLDHIEFEATITTEFTGYHELETTSEITALIQDNEHVSFIPAESNCWIITKKSPFFIVGGGQVPDKGWLIIQEHTVPINEVRYINGRIAAHITSPIALKIGNTVTSRVDKQWRTKAMKNHTATHLLQAALIELFGKQIKQSGSLVHPDYLRFDFTYHANLRVEEIKKVEDLVNEKIRENIPVHIEYASFKEAINQGVLAFFGEKYNPEQVRIVSISSFSMELCGGTHVQRTGDIGIFKITDVSSIAAGHRRIIALTGPKAVELFQDNFNTIKTLSSHFNVKNDQIIDFVEKQSHEIKEVHKQIKQLKQLTWQSNIRTWLAEVKNIKEVPFLFVSIKDTEHDELKDIAQKLQDTKPGFYVLVSAKDNRFLFFATVAEKYAKSINLKQMAAFLKEAHNIKGGGSPLLLQGGGNFLDPKLEASIITWLKKSMQ